MNTYPTYKGTRTKKVTPAPLRTVDDKYDGSKKRGKVIAKSKFFCFPCYLCFSLYIFFFILLFFSEIQLSQDFEDCSEEEETVLPLRPERLVAPSSEGSEFIGQVPFEAPETTTEYEYEWLGDLSTASQSPEGDFTLPPAPLIDVQETTPEAAVEFWGPIHTSTEAPVIFTDDDQIVFLGTLEGSTLASTTGSVFAQPGDSTFQVFPNQEPASENPTGTTTSDSGSFVFWGPIQSSTDAAIVSTGAPASVFGPIQPFSDSSLVASSEEPIYFFGSIDSSTSSPVTQTSSGFVLLNELTTTASQSVGVSEASTEVPSPGMFSFTEIII